MANNLKDHLKEVADAIRAKKGTTDLINPQDFATEIEDGLEYYLIDGAKLQTVIGELMGTTDVTQIRPVLINIIGADYMGRDLSYTVYIYRGSLRQANSILDASDSSAEDFLIEKLVAVKRIKEDSEVTTYKDMWTAVLGIDPVSFLTPCTGEEFYALITK